MHPDLELRLIASGSHLSPEFGNTISEIEAEGYPVDARIEILLSSDSTVGVVKSMGVGLISFSDAIQRIAPDLFVVLGDRFEAHAATTAAMILGVPIAHIHGGEITMGAYDDMLRHSITKMSNLHFVANEAYAKRVIQLGEHPSTVFNVGAMGLDGLDDLNDLTEKELSQKLNFDLGANYFVVTYHPVTNGDEPPLETLKNILKGLEKFPNHKVVITLPNADNGSREIIYFIEEYVSQNSNKVIATHSLGHNLFISLLRRASAFVGNSSSGIIEAPSLSIPTVNVGVRQAGRLAANSVISCSGNFDDIFSAVKLALSPSFQVISRSCINPYGSGGVAEKIIDVLIKIKLAFPKKFYDL
jgi:UDP-N-acetylglucosamine 2-epimerase (non-hydrolysing)